MKIRFKTQGFTLIEILIALVILAIALTAVVKATEDNSRNTIKIQNRVISHWVAMNAIAQMQLGVTALPNGSAKKAQTKMLNHTWYWTATIISDKRHIAQVKVAVSAEKNERPITQLTGFVYQQNEQHS